ncbi:MAG TPA: helix-turn-helix domain-containing protein [Candidatus Elarobacter sp.]|jgi:predicted ATPase/DNA-binding XRE family transcriptional regulator|nr:helix-turn-helix domain-containing protein [Candidatus Elarobacter sp.]
MSCTFGDMLREHRIAAGLTQDQLADRARLSSKAVSAIERGARRRPYAATISALAEALALSGAALAEFRDVAVRRPASRTFSLPRYTTSYVERPSEHSELAGLLRDHTLVTVVGAGGTGKTRLAVQVAGDVVPSSYESVVFVDCDSLGDGDRITEHICAELSRARRVLVILDSCERAIPSVRRLIEAFRNVSSAFRFLATSRQRVRVSGEAIYPLHGFAVPSERSREHELTPSAPARLFQERALMRDRSFALTHEVHAVVLEICRRLEGLPLAIELAASRVGALSVFEIRDELFRTYSILSTEYRDVPARHRSLAASIDWSLSDLAPEEREALSRLTAFRRSFTVQAAEALLDDAANRSPLAVIASLVEKSLIATDSSAGTARYRLTEATRAFVRDVRTDAPALAASARRHARWLAEFADEADATYLRMPHGSWMKMVGSWLDDARAAVGWALGEGDDPDVAGRIIGGLRGIWRTSGFASECCRWVEATLPLLDAASRPAVVSRVYRALAQTSTGFPRVEAALRSKALAESAGDRVAIAASATMITEGLFEMGHYGAALETVSRNARLIEEMDLRETLLYARTFYDRSLIFRAVGQPERVAGELEAAMRIASRTGDDWVALDIRSVSADLASDAGNHADALSVANEALQHARGLGWDVFVVSSLNSIAASQLSMNRTEDALSSAADALALSRGRDALGFDTSLEHLAMIAASRGRFRDAALLHAFVENSLERKAYIRTRGERRARNAFVERLRGGLGADRFALLSEAGRTLTETVVADLALAAASA